MIFGFFLSGRIHLFLHGHTLSVTVTHPSLALLCFFFGNSRHWILKATFPPNAKRKRVAAGTGGRERGNRERRVEGVRFRRSWGNFVSVLIDFGPFEILLPIKLTVCCAISTAVQTFLPFESFLPFFLTEWPEWPLTHPPTQLKQFIPKVYLSLGLMQETTRRTGVIVKLRPQWNK